MVYKVGMMKLFNFFKKKKVVEYEVNFEGTSIEDQADIEVEKFLNTERYQIFELQKENKALREEIKGVKEEVSGLVLEIEQKACQIERHIELEQKQDYLLVERIKNHNNDAERNSYEYNNRLKELQDKFNTKEKENIFLTEKLYNKGLRMMQVEDKVHKLEAHDYEGKNKDLKERVNNLSTILFKRTGQEYVSVSKHSVSNQSKELKFVIEVSEEQILFQDNETICEATSTHISKYLDEKRILLQEDSFYCCDKKFKDNLFKGG